MFKKTIKFEDFNGVEVEKDFYFHISKADLIRMGVRGEGDMEARIKRIIAAKDNEAIFREFEDIIRLSVGIRSADGQSFIKTEAAQSQLLNSPAYDELMVELATDAAASSEFIRNLLPEKMQKELKTQLEVLKEDKTPDPFAEKEDTRPAWEREHRHPTDAEVQNMDKAELVRAMRFRTGQNPSV
jgi:predicted secreted protein